MKNKTIKSKNTKPAKYGSVWTDREIKALKSLAKRNAPPIVMEIALERTKESIYSKASKEGISLK